MILVLSAFGCRPPTDVPPPTPTVPATTSTVSPSFPWPVVVPEQPLVLVNPQQDRVVWPIWGGAFLLETEPVAIRVAMDTTGTAGLLLAGPGAAGRRVGVEVVGTDGGWVLRETDGGEPVQEVSVVGAVAGIDVRPDRVTVGETELVLSGSLGDEVGIYVTLEPEASLTVGDLALSAPLPARPDLGVPLRTLAEARGISIGSATDLWPPIHDLGFESLFDEQFGTASPTEFYWPTTRGEDQDWFFVPADLMVNYATVHGQSVTGMFLVWDFALPRWLKDLAGDPAALGPVYDEHVTTLVTRYRGRVDRWIVVNEAIWGPGDAGNPRAKFAETLWSDTLGPDHIERAFVLARAADPDAVLLYNETGAEAVNEKSDFLFAMAEDFVARGVPLDGIGLQFHVDAASPPDMASVRANFERFGSLGLTVHVTELDVSLAHVDLPEGDAEALQASIYADVVEVCLAVPACRGTTVFGFSDRYAWDALGDATPLLFDEDYVAKPAYYAVQAALE